MIRIDFSPGLIHLLIHADEHRQPCFGGCLFCQFFDNVIIRKDHALPFPGQMRKHAMFNPIILGTVWWVMLNLDGESDPVRHLLKIIFDNMGTTTITPTPITAENEFVRLWILLFEVTFPPRDQIVSRKFRRIFTCP